MIIKKNSAFLLIEVLVTVVIVATSVIFINHTFTSSLRAMTLSNDYLNATSLLKDKMFDIELNPYAEEGEYSGECEFMGEAFTWQESVLAPDKDDAEEEYAEKDLGIKKLEYSVKWQRRQTQRSMTVSTYVWSKKSEE